MNDKNDQTRISPPASLAVLYADVVGSTRLYEKHGDAVAQKDISTCLSLLSGVVEQSGGRVVKSLGDEIECVFTDPIKAIVAGTDMQPVIQHAGNERQFATGPLRIKVGLHYGPASAIGDQVRGEAPAIAHEIIKMAKADQVLTSGPTLDAAPGAMRLGARHVDQVAQMEHGNKVDVYELIWEDAGVTHASPERPTRERGDHTRLVLSCGEQEFEMGEARPTLTIGRTGDQNIIVPTDLTSRLHAEINFIRGRFRITDMSANGTLVLRDDGTSTTLRREQLTLHGSGRICFGGTPDENPGGVFGYRCM